MIRVFSRKQWVSLAVCCGLFLVCGCNRISGKYQDTNGMMAIEFKSGKAYMTTMGITTEADYDVDGDKVTLHSPNGNLVLTKQSDGSLAGPLDEKLIKQ
jgi:hypothetical protein